MSDTIENLHNWVRYFNEHDIPKGAADCMAAAEEIAQMYRSITQCKESKWRLRGYINQNLHRIEDLEQALADKTECANALGLEAANLASGRKVEEE